MVIATAVADCLERNNVPYAVISHRPATTSRDTAAAAAVPPCQIAKPVILNDSHGYLMVVVPGDCHVEVDKVARQLNRGLHLATEDDFTHLFRDCEPHVVPPLGPCYGIETIVDDRLLQQNEICFVAGDREELIRVNREVFLTLLKGARITRLAICANPGSTVGLSSNNASCDGY